MTHQKLDTPWTDIKFRDIKWIIQELIFNPQFKALKRILVRTSLLYFILGFCCGISGGILAFVVGINGVLIGNGLFIILGIPVTIWVYTMLLSVNIPHVTEIPKDRSIPKLKK